MCATVYSNEWVWIEASQSVLYSGTYQSKAVMRVKMVSSIEEVSRSLHERYIPSNASTILGECGFYTNGVYVAACRGSSGDDTWLLLRKYGFGEKLKAHDLLSQIFGVYQMTINCFRGTIDQDRSRSIGRVLASRLHNAHKF
jgi:hypothetical protein